jgi:hypothetical protein
MYLQSRQPQPRLCYLYLRRQPNIRLSSSLPHRPIHLRHLCLLQVFYLSVRYPRYLP